MSLKMLEFHTSTDNTKIIILNHVLWIYHRPWRNIMQQCYVNFSLFSQPVNSQIVQVMSSFIRAEKYFFFIVFGFGKRVHVGGYTLMNEMQWLRTNAFHSGIRLFEKLHAHHDCYVTMLITNVCHLRGLFCCHRH